MPNIYEDLRRLADKTGWKGGKIAIESGVGSPTVYRAMCDPSYEVSQTTAVLIQKVKDQYAPSPFPLYLELEIGDYNERRTTLSQNKFKDYNWAKEIIFEQTLSTEKDFLALCRKRWLLGHIAYDRAFYLKINVDKSANQTIARYQQAIDALQKASNIEEDERKTQHLKLLQDVMAAKFMRVSAQDRKQDKELHQWLKESQCIEMAIAIVEREPWNWDFCRNGLIAASILQRRDDCCTLWEKLQKIGNLSNHNNFANLDYVPRKGVPSLKTDPDLQWFRQEILKIKH